ncbi:MAG: hypothetical protein RMI56_03735 [Sulfolobales archaeon]|nr:hypothetical protein [Sulfolobales archaeon]
MRAQGSVLTELLMAGAALIIGISILSYFMSFSTSYSQQVELANTLNYEAANQVVRLITYDSVNRVVWLLFRRLDSASRNFIVLLRSANTFLPCSNVFIYNSVGDTDRVVCNEVNIDCVESCRYNPQREQARNIFISLERGVMSLSDYLKIPPTTAIELIRIPYTQIATGPQAYSIIVRVNLADLSRDSLIVYLCVDHGDRFYIVRAYEVSLR